ncbi:MAG TPA: hypothetical protein VGF67_15540 [Ktedonobacteraceae bacterium]
MLCLELAVGDPSGLACASWSAVSWRETIVIAQGMTYPLACCGWTDRQRAYTADLSCLFV